MLCWEHKATLLTCSWLYIAGIKEVEGSFQTAQSNFVTTTCFYYAAIQLWAMCVPHLKVNRIILGDFLLTLGCEMSACQKQANREMTWWVVSEVSKPQETHISVSFLFNIPDTEMKTTLHGRLCWIRTELSGFSLPLLSMIVPWVLCRAETNTLLDATEQRVTEFWTFLA